METNSEQSFSLSVFFPFYNEEENVAPAVEQTLEILMGMKNLSNFEIIIVDDGSKDRTLEIAKKLAAENTRIKIISHQKNLGYGHALLSGIRAAQFEYVFFTDGDLQFDIRELPSLCAYLSETDVVIGYRAPRNDPFMRILNAIGWNILNRLFFGLKIKDIDCAFKVFKKELVAELPLVSGGAMLSAEILIRLQRKGIVIKEVPVTHLPRKKGSATGAKPEVIFRALKEFWHLFWNYSF